MTPTPTSSIYCASTPALLHALPDLAPAKLRASAKAADSGHAAPSFRQALEDTQPLPKKTAGNLFLPLQKAGLPAPPASTPVPPEIRKVAQEFEATFLAQMLKPMFENVGKNAVYGQSYASGVYQSLMVDEYGKTLSEAGGIGIARQIEHYLIHSKESVR